MRLFGLLLALATCPLLVAQPRATVGSPLGDAVMNGDLSAARKAIASGANVNEKVMNGWPLLVEAVQKIGSPHSIEMVHLLVDHGADVNAAQTDQGWTPLISECQSVQTSLADIDYLVKHGANLEAQMPGMGTALHAAARFHRTDIVRYLLAHGAKVDARSVPNLNLHFIGDQGSIFNDVPEARAENDWATLITEPGSMTSAGRTPLMEVCMADAAGVEMMKLLIEHGAKVDARDDIGRTALHWACYGKRRDKVEFLLARGADVRAVTKNGFTPLHIACQPTPFGFVDPLIVKTLLAKGADPGARTTTGKTPLDLIEEASAGFSTFMANSPKAPDPEIQQSWDRGARQFQSQAGEIEALLKAAMPVSNNAFALWIAGVAAALAIAAVAVVLFRGKA